LFFVREVVMWSGSGDPIANDPWQTDFNSFPKSRSLIEKKGVSRDSSTQEELPKEETPSGGWVDGQPS